LRRLVLINENAPYQRESARHPKSRGTNLGNFDGFAHVLANGQVPLDQPERANVLESSKSFSPVEEVV
jgi:hypothetical protein